MPYIIRPKQIRRIAVGLLSALLVSAAPAMASTSSCAKSVTSHAFAKFGDNANYTLLEGGLFEKGAPGWSLYNAEIINENPEEENQGYDVRNEDGQQHSGQSHSLAIASGGRAVSPPFCVNSEYPSFRFLARQHGEDPRGSLDVSLRWSDSHGSHETADATLQDGRHWTLSPVIELASKLPAGTTPNVRLVFQPTRGSWVIDDVYIDPYSR
jgi:hypothetical protein